MKKYLEYLKIIGIMILSFFISYLLLTILSYFNIIGNKFLSILEIITILIIMFIGGLLGGKKTNNKGWLEGLKIGLIFSLLLFIINLLFIKDFSLKSIIYYFILSIASTFGGMIGILKK